ncbi:MAG: hypothetical protein WA021_05605 [Minisyncoccia bacterium]
MAKKITLEDIGKSMRHIVEHMATKDDISELNRRVGALESGQKEILDVLEPLSRAHDKDSVMIMSHERRLARIEKRVGIGRS